jgi:hypothetical protein
MSDKKTVSTGRSSRVPTNLRREMTFEEEQYDWRDKPLEKGKMSIKQLRKAIKKSPGISGVGEALEKFLTQFSKLELLWIETEIKYKLKEKYKFQ